MVRALRLIRWGAIGALLAIVLVAGAVALDAATGAHIGGPAITQLADRLAGRMQTPAADAVVLPGGVPIGGPFSLVDDHGKAVTEADYRGRWMLVFFGYTHCPDVCPLTLQKMASALAQLGRQADRVAPLFITVDPKRDTPERLASYIAKFDPRIIGLTGSAAAIAKVAAEYRVYYSPANHEKSGTDLVNHSAFLYLLGPHGGFRALFPQTITAARLAISLKRRVR